MQERRTNIRIAHAVGAQYCPSDDLLPRDGKLQDVSERGARLLAREPRRLGDRITVTFPLEPREEPLTLTGEVRWSAPSGRWCATGMEWLTLDPASSYRLHTFLHDRSEERRGRRSLWDQVPASPRPGLVGFAAGGIVLALLAFAVWSLRQTNAQLDAALQQRDAVIGQMQSRAAQLTTALGQAQSDLERATAEVARMDAQAQSLQVGAEQLTNEIQRFQLAYAKTQFERSELIDQIVSLEQERTLLMRKLSSLPELRLAVREAIQARMAEDRLRPRPRWGTDESDEWGNRGYVIMNAPAGQATGGVSITVHDPFAPTSSPAQAQALASTVEAAPTSAPAPDTAPESAPPIEPTPTMPVNSEQ